MVNKMTYAVRAKWVRTWFDNGKSREMTEVHDVRARVVLDGETSSGGDFEAFEGLDLPEAACH